MCEYDILEMDTIGFKLREIREMYKETEKIVIIGAGFHGYMACEDCEKKGKEILFVCDNDSLKHTEKFFYSKKQDKWIGVYSLDKLYELHEEILCLVSARTPYKALAQQLSGMGIKRYTSHFSYMRSFEWDRIVKIYNCLQREKSKKILRALLTVDLTGDPNIYGYIYKNDQYFGIPEVAYIDPNEIMCEVGAYVGDVVERYIQKKLGIFNKIYAFEPAEKEYVAMKNRVERLKKEWAIDDSKIELVKAAASNIDKIGFATQHITGLRVDGNGEEKIDIVKLDSYFREKRITFLIADIEGEEMRMLEGMEQVIVRDKPKFAIAIYHKASDIFEIPNKLLSLRDDYKFDILHHHEGCGETVLYAY